MSSVSVSVAATNKLTALTPDAVIGDSVTPSSESNFSGVLDASLPSDLPAKSDLPPAGKELPAESSDPSTSLSGLAETAADILMTLQASRDMSSSLQTGRLSLVANQQGDVATENDEFGADDTEFATSSPPPKLVPIMNAPINVGSDVQVTDTTPTIDDPLLAPILDEKLNTPTDVSSSVTPKKGIQPSAALAADNQPTSTQVSVSADLSKPVDADTAAVKNITDASESTDKTDQKVKHDEASVSDPALVAMLATLQPISDNVGDTDSETISDAALMSAVSNANDVMGSEKTATTATAKSTAQVHSEGHKDKASDKAALSSDNLVTTNLSADNGAMTESDDAAVTDPLNEVSSEGVTSASAAEITNVQVEHSSHSDVGISKELATANVSLQENSAASTTGKNVLSSASSLPEQAQSLHSVSEQLPSLYVKNGHVEEHELAARVMLMVGQKWQEAELELEPQGMGKIRVQLSIDQEQQTNVQFMVQHSQAKEALDQSMPRLRELLAQHGLQPGQTQVQQQAQDNSGQSWNQQMANNSAAEQQEKRGSSATGNAFSGSKEDDFVQTVTVSASDAAGIDFYA
jgi:flagellar hook-length control protein FliK